MAKKDSLKNCKPLVELIDASSPDSLVTLSVVDCFGFLSTIDLQAAANEARSAIKQQVQHLRPDVIALANQEAVRMLQLLGFRTERILKHAEETLAHRRDVDTSDYDARADAMARLAWLRAKVPRLFDEIETIFLTHHFHGHRKLHGFAVADGDGREFHWSDEIGDRLHEAVAEILDLDDQARQACELIHFEMAETESNDRRFHYVVVYHPGKMKVLRQMKERHRDLLTFIPALEATLVYDPQQRRIHVLSDRPTVAKRLADRFSQVGFEQPLSRQPVDAVRYDLRMFRGPIDWSKAHAPGASVRSAWASSITVTLGHSRHTVTLDLAHPDDAWRVSSQSFGSHDPLSACHRVVEVKLAFVVVFDGDNVERSLDLCLDDRGACNLLNLTDPRMRRCGEALLTSLGIMHRVAPPPSSRDVDQFRSELALLDLGTAEIEGLCIREMGLDAEQLSQQGLLTPSGMAKEITILVDDEDGHRVLRRLEVHESSTQTWVQDELTGTRIDLQDVDQRRYRIDPHYLLERLRPMLVSQLTDLPLSPDDSEPYFLGHTPFGNQQIPVYLASRLWNSRHADRLDTLLRQSGSGVSVVLSTTASATRRFLGPCLVVPIAKLIVESASDFTLDLSRIAGEVRRWRDAAAATERPALIKDGPYSAMLIGPWASPWTLTKPDWINVIDIMVDIWNSGVRKISKTDLAAKSGVSIRSMRETFKEAPEWEKYIRGADGNAKPRVWELSIGPPVTPKVVDESVGSST